VVGRSALSLSLSGASTCVLFDLSVALFIESWRQSMMNDSPSMCVFLSGAV